MNEQQNELEDRLASLTTWPEAEHEPTLWKSALERDEEPRTLWLPPKRVLGVAAMVMLAVVGVWAVIGAVGEDELQPPVMLYAKQWPAEAAVEDRQINPPSMRRALELPFAVALDVQPRAIQRSASMDLHTDRVRALHDRVLELVDPGLGEFVEDSSATEDGASATLRVSAQRLDTVMRSIREMDGVTDVLREELSAADATDRRADLDARLANERRIEVELLELIDKRPDAPLADVLRVREALSEVRLNIERLDAQRATLNERVALATLRVSILQVSEEREPKPDASGFLHDLGDAFTRGGQTLAGSAAWIVEAVVGGLIAWVILAVVGIWAYRTLQWRATWA